MAHCLVSHDDDGRGRASLLVRDFGKDPGSREVSMAVKIDDLRVGRCYVTPSGQVRRVTHIETIKKITYETRGKRAIPKGKPWNSEPRDRKGGNVCCGG